MKHPYLTDDGTHVLPVRNVGCEGCERFAGATGELRWHYERGAHFSVHFPGVPHFELPRYFRHPTIPSNRTVADWTAETVDGHAVAIYAINVRPVSTHHISLGQKPRDSSRVDVEAIYACVDLAKETQLAYWHSTTPTTRMMCLGFRSDAWSVNDEVVYEDSNRSVHTVGRGSIELCSAPCLRLVSEAHLDSPTGVAACWLVTDQQSVGLTYPHSTERGFISFLSGKRTRFFWHDTFLNGNSLRRTYYGWQRVARHELEMTYSQPLPLWGTVDAINHARTVIASLPALYSEFAKQSSDLRVSWILNPIWAGATEILDDQFTFACVSLERLAQAWKDSDERNQGPKLFEKSLAAKVKIAVRKRMQAIVKVMQLSPTQAELLDKRVNDICRPPNADQLSGVFTDLGITLSAVDRKMLNDRNKALHGRATLTPLCDHGASSAELLRCHRLQTLISTAILRILKYKGPYINFAARGGSQVEYL